MHAEKIQTCVVWAQIIGDNRPSAAVQLEGVTFYFASSAQIAQLQKVLSDAAARLDDLAAKGVPA